MRKAKNTFLVKLLSTGFAIILSLGVLAQASLKANAAEVEQTSSEIASSSIQINEDITDSYFVTKDSTGPNNSENTINSESLGDGDSAAPIFAKNTVNDVVWTTHIYADTSANRPVGGYTSSASIHLANVERYQMFYAYIELHYENYTNQSLTSPVITLQLPKIGEPGYYEAMAPNQPPSGWVSYSNLPSVDANSTFLVSGMAYDADTSIVSWAAQKSIDHGETGTVYIKIPMRDPYTQLGTFDYLAQIQFSLNNAQQTITDSATLIVEGEKDEVPYSINRVQNLSFVPDDPDADQYYYQLYSVTNSYSYNYLVPSPSYHKDQYLFSHSINVQLPDYAEIVSYQSQIAEYNAINNTLSFLRYFADGYTSEFVVRYPKANYTNPDAEVTLAAVVNGRYAADAPPSYNIADTNKDLSHAVGLQSIPDARLGRVSLGQHFNYGYSQGTQVSEESLKFGAIPFGALMTTYKRTNSTIMADELVYEFNGVYWVKDGVATAADYDINMLYIETPTWVGQTSPSLPTIFEGRVIYNDNSTDLLFSKTAEEISSGTAALYTGNTGQKAVYSAPEGKTVQKFIITVKNAPSNLNFPGIYVNGYVSSYPQQGADLLRLSGFAGVYGYDIGSGRPTAANTGTFNLDYEIVKDTKYKAIVTAARSSASSINPGNTDVIRLIAKFDDKATQSFINPYYNVLLPEGVTYRNVRNRIVEYQGTYASVYNLPDGGLSAPEVSVINNFNGTGRQLVRIYHTGLLQEDETLHIDLTVNVLASVPSGNHLVEVYFSATNPGFENNLDNSRTPVITDNTNIANKGIVNDKLFYASVNLPVSRGVGTLLYTEVKGVADGDFSGYAVSRQNDFVDGNLVLDYNGLTPMKGIQLLSVLPYEGDGSSLWGTLYDDQRIVLADAIDLTAYPGAVAYYNNTATSNPLDSGWSLTYSAETRSVRVDMPDSFEMISGGVEKLSIPLKMQVPGISHSPSDLECFVGTGILPVKAYAQTVLSAAGTTGSSSAIESFPRGINVTVFVDENQNGILDTDENYLSDATVSLYSAGANPQAELPLYSFTTNDEGFVYFYDNVNPVAVDFSTYMVKVDAKDGEYLFVSGIGEVSTDQNGLAMVQELTPISITQNILAGVYKAANTVPGSPNETTPKSPGGFLLPLTGGNEYTSFIIIGLCVVTLAVSGIIALVVTKPAHKKNGKTKSKQ